ncbi:30S ribosomal protein S17 [Candidatus Vidania fulgoroideorum]
MKKIQGSIIKLSSNKTASVLTNVTKSDKKYRKNYIVDKKILVHYNCSFLKKNMKVIIVNLNKKFSKNKNWKIFKILDL